MTAMDYPPFPAPSSLGLPFDQTTLTQGIRVKPATFARMVGVSKQCVSQWVKSGKVTLFPDGTLDPARAAKQVIDNSDPARLRARVFKTAMDDVGALRRRIGSLEAELAEALERTAFLEQFSRNQDDAERIFVRLLIAHRTDLIEASADGFAAKLEQLLDAAILATDKSGQEDLGAPIEATEGGGGAAFDPVVLAAEMENVARNLPGAEDDLG